MGRFNIRKEDILMRVNTYDIFRHFLKDKYDAEGVSMKPGVHIYVPEISGKQKSPSFNVYFSRRSNEYRYKDFTGHDGSAFDLVMNLYNASFTEAISIINKEMNLGLESEDIEYTKVKPKEEINVESDRNYDFDIKYDKWRKRHLEFWSNYGVSQKTLEKYNIRPVYSLSYFNRHNDAKYIESRLKSVIFSYNGDGFAKIYFPEIPYIQNKGFIYIGKKPDDYVFGFDQLPEKGKDLYLLAGEKDVVSAYSHGMNAVCLASEESTPRNYPKFLELINSDRFENYWVSYDNDTTGLRRAKEISDEFPRLKVKTFPIEENDDLSDYLIKQYKSKMF